jgi:hypothetical protein
MLYVGMAVAAQRDVMLHFFRAGPDLVRWELTEIEPDGSCRLSVHHAHGTIVEYFRTAAMAVRRMQELEELLIRARGFAANCASEEVS